MKKKKKIIRIVFRRYFSKSGKFDRIIRSNPMTNISGEMEKNS